MTPASWAASSAEAIWAHKSPPPAPGVIGPKRFNTLRRSVPSIMRIST